MKIKATDDADVNITSLIDCLMQVIIFFMVIMSVQYVFGVAIKFSAAADSKGGDKKNEEKSIVVYVQSDWVDVGHYLIREGILKLNGEEIPLSISKDRTQWDAERKRGFETLEAKIGELLKQGYKKDVLMIQGDNLTYHGKIMEVIDRGKANKIDGYALIVAE